MVEARQRVDAFDARVPSEGVIVYEVLNPDTDPNPAFTKPTIVLRTPSALTPGQTFASASGTTVRVIGTLAGGFTVRVDDRRSVRVPDVVGDRTIDAEAIVRRVGLVPRGMGPRKSTFYVHSQEPDGGELADWGSTVVLRSALGPPTPE